MTVEKNQNPGGRFGATIQTAPPIQPILPAFLVNGPNLIFSIVLGAKYSFYVKSIATYAPSKS